MSDAGGQIIEANRESADRLILRAISGGGIQRGTTMFLCWALRPAARGG